MDLANPKSNWTFRTWIMLDWTYLDVDVHVLRGPTEVWILDNARINF